MNRDEDGVWWELGGCLFILLASAFGVLVLIAVSRAIVGWL